MKTPGRILLIEWAILLWQVTVYSQTVYFNKTIDLQGEWGMGMSVIEQDSAYYIAGIAGPGYNIGIVEVGWTGNEEGWVKKYGKPGESWYPGNPGSLCLVEPNGYILGGSKNDYDSIYGTLLRFDNQFDTIYSRKFSSHINYALILTCSKPTFDGGFVLTGQIYIGENNSDFILLKTDSLGNELWRATKNIGIADRGWSIIQTLDSGYVIGGYHYTPGVYHSGDPLIVKFDKNGSFLWSRNPGGQFMDEKAMVALNEDSTFTVLTSIADSIYNNDFGYARICVIKYTQDGEELWRRKYGESIGGNHVTNIRSLQDGGYICCGRQKEPGNYNVYRFGWLLRLNSEGDSIWFRKYSHGVDHPFYYNSIMDVYPTLDEGFIATGQVYDDPPNSLQRIWVLKVDSIGCDTAGCDPTVGIGDGRTVGRYEGEECELMVWPNPCSTLLNISLSSTQPAITTCHPERSEGSHSSYTADVYDIFGRQAPIPNPSPTRGKGEVSLDVSALPPGLYLLVLKDGLTVKASAKFVVAR